MKSTKFFAIGSTLLTGLTLGTVHAETSNPFSMKELSTGYMQLAEVKTDTKTESGKMKMAACGEGKCGGSVMKGSEEKNAEGNCAGNKPIPKTTKEAKCGEGKCGNMAMDKK